MLGVQAAGLFDPLTLLIRSLSLSVYPFLSYALRSIFTMLYEWHIPLVSSGAEVVYELLKRSVLPFSQPLFFQGTAIGLLFFALLALNLRESRFWCKYLCPLGALLGLLSRFALLKRSVSEGCNDCGRCRASVRRGDRSKGANGCCGCLYCFNCDDPCRNMPFLLDFPPDASFSLDWGEGGSRRRCCGGSRPRCCGSPHWPGPERPSRP